MSPAEQLLLQAWEKNQEAQFMILQALSDYKDGGVEFDPLVSITNAIGLQTISSQKITEAKTLIPK